MRHTWEKCYSLHGFPKKTENASKLKNSKHKLSKDEYQEYLRLKFNSQAQSSSVPNVSTACISQSMDSQGPWIIDSGAFDHIYGDSSLFNSLFSPKFPHLITIAKGLRLLLKELTSPSFSFLKLQICFLCP